MTQYGQAQRKQRCTTVLHAARHAPQEAARILGESMNFARQGQVALRDPGFKPTVEIIDIPSPPPSAPAAADALTQKRN